LLYAHETLDSIGLISYAGCLGLSPVISAKIHFLSVRCSLKSLKIHYEPRYFFDFKVVQGQRCWYPRKARQ